jgi:hypothetical protein
MAHGGRLQQATGLARQSQVQAGNEAVTFAGRDGEPCVGFLWQAGARDDLTA